MGINSYPFASLWMAYKIKVTLFYECDVFVSTSAGWKFGQHKISIRRSLIFKDQLSDKLMEIIKAGGH